MPDSLREAVLGIPGEAGWWNRDGADVYEAAARRLVDLGMPEAEVIDLLGSLLFAAAAEYGD